MATSPKPEGKTTKRQPRTSKPRAVSVLPTTIWKMNKEQLSALSFKPDGMAEAVIQALRKHGTKPGEPRKRVAGEVKAKFAEAHDSTIRTQVYRGIAYLKETRQQ